MTYTLTKLKLNEGKYSRVPEGTRTTLPFLSFVDAKSSEVRRYGNFAEEIREGNRVVLQSLVQYHVTSEISEILERSDKSVTFKTHTSVYSLEEN